MVDIIVGRLEKDRKKYGDKGTISIGKHYVKMGQTTALSGNVKLDVSGAHVMLICGKRGGGKSYTMGVIAEGFELLEEEIKQNLSIILLDTMGIYWTMKYPNKEDPDLLDSWGLEPRGMPVVIFTPYKHHKLFKEQGIPTDYPFSLTAHQINEDDWCNAFKQDKYSSIGVLISKTIEGIREVKEKYTIKDIIVAIKKDEESNEEIKNAVQSMFETAESWGVFSDEGTDFKELSKGGQTTVIDLSCYATMPGGWDIKALIVGIIGQHLFIQRMNARKKEEYDTLKSSMDYFTEEKSSLQEMPLVWLVIDEAHEFLPNKGKTAATDALVTIMREGRQPGISLILATQQPGKIHTDVMTQSDIVLSHRITAKIDTDALGLLMQSYMRTGLVQELNDLPREKGAGIIFDDSNEKMYPIRIRPRVTWHGGGSPTAIPDDKDKIEL